ncbi:carboxyl-terminal PDZ ligand of neuronal nitric oxide synthase protein-like isoform X3 [Catharus ustulatus]|uniref:carboxyl-terminal PDZ ligand of neuronal nitric oxide synthase protein-like isoform X3 n=1 Tax=Catharus ustulatus TaxID=91951 RepID=UPI00140ADBB5|nr:carboxyl-terminal PDZ ligand of neuronal nitric oxide synthase protein-like isoform X3 [Catharus ustulatus]
MEALRAAGRAVLRSPRLARHGLGLRRRRKLPESWADMQEPLLEGMCFTLKYLGMTLVEKPKGEDMAAAAIRRIVATARVGARKFQKVILTVSPRGISLQDADTKEMVENISIYRISYCTTDKLQNKVFAYVAQSQESGALECHAFLSPKKKIAQAVTLTVAQAFQMALDLWEATHAGSRQDQPLHPSCVLESSEPGRPCEPAPPGSAPFTHQFGEEEEELEEEEDDSISETLSGSMEELGRGAHSPAGKFPQCCTGSSPMSSVRQGGADAHLGMSASPRRLCWAPSHTPYGPCLPFSHFSELIPLVPPPSSPTAQLLCYRLGPPPDSWMVLAGAGDCPSTGPRTADPKTPLG